MVRSKKNNKETQLPYQPSWIDRITALVNKTRIPFAIVYILVWLVFFIALILLRWQDGTFPVGTINNTDVVMSLTGIFFVALVHYLDNWAIKKLRIFRESILVPDEEFEGLAYRLSSLPPRPTLIASLISFGFGGITFIITPTSYDFIHIGFNSPSSILQLINFLFGWFTFGALSYHVFHQLTLGGMATANYLRINLFNLSPVYTFAGLTMRSAMGWLIVAYAWALTTPNLFQNFVIIATIGFMQVVAVLTFILPLLGAHEKIVEKKAESLHEISTRMENVVDEMSKVNENYDKDRLSKLKDILSTLSMAEERIQKIPTWPWKPSVVNSLATAILLPNAVWVFQLVVEQFFLK
ncbi:MAG TPA: hypothetical protein VLA72_22045 [Anaerolineales bacterium]|nr:hypothetical protein [Anaerolineales bacterium]